MVPDICTQPRHHKKVSYGPVNTFSHISVLKLSAKIVNAIYLLNIFAGKLCRMCFQTSIVRCTRFIMVHKLQ